MTGSRTRLAVGGLVALGVALALAFWASTSLGAWLADEPAADPDAAPADTTTACLRAKEPSDVADINANVASYRRVPGFVGADVGASLRLTDGRTMWVFGDTLRQKDFDGPGFVRNSMLLIGNDCATVVMPADKGAVVPDRADGVGYWPMSLGMRHVDGVDMVGVGLLRVRATGEGTFDFEILGSSVAEFTVAPDGDPQLVSVRDVGPDRVDDTRPTWGAAVAVGDPWIYVYGTANPDKEKVLGWSLHVARLRVEDLTDPAAWQYWNGRRWSSRSAGLGTLIPATNGVSRVLSVFEQDGSWYAVSKRNDFVGTDLVIWKAPAPTGPFVAGRALAQIPSDDGVLQYMPLAHPELLPEPGSVVVSWSRNVADLEEIARDPTLYRPEFTRVPLP